MAKCWPKEWPNVFMGDKYSASQYRHNKSIHNTKNSLEDNKLFHKDLGN